MKLKHLLGAAMLAMVSATPCFADDVMVVENVSGGDPVKVDVPSMAKLTFGATTMTIVTYSDEIEVPYSAIRKIVFEEGATEGLTTLVDGKSKIEVKYIDESLVIKTDKDEFDLAIFSINGTTVVSRSACTAKTIDVSRLSAGVYIAKIDSAVIKFVKK